MIFGGVNLARRPFSNRRPVVRVTAIFWLLGVAAAAANVWLYWDYWSGTDNTADQLAAIEQKIAESGREIRSLEASLSGQNLGAGNEQAAYLNTKIAARRFAWSRLLDDLGDVLPLKVRIDSLAPTVVREGATQPGRGGAPRSASQSGGDGPPVESVHLRIHGIAEHDEALFELLDKLYAHRAFSNPDLKNEKKQDLRIEFNLTVTYDPSQSGDGPRSAPVAELAPPTSGSPRLAERSGEVANARGRR